MSSDTSCEESSVREGAGYDETYGSGDKSDFSLPLERERRRHNLLTLMRVWLREIRMRREGMEWMLTKRRATGLRDPVKEPRRVPEITVPSFFLRIGPSTNFS